MIHVSTDEMQLRGPNEIAGNGRCNMCMAGVQLRMRKQIVSIDSDCHIFFKSLACEFDNKPGNDIFVKAWQADCHHSCLNRSHRIIMERT